MIVSQSAVLPGLASISLAPISAASLSREFQKDLIALIPFLRAFARSMCLQRDRGDDLAQDTLAKAWKARASFQAGSNLKAWLFTILRNEYYSQQRRRWRQTQWDQVKGENIAAPPDSQYWSMALGDAAQALRELPDTQREALVLVAAGGHSYEEAAIICNAPVGTIKSRVARGRAALLQLVDGDLQRPRRNARATLVPDDILAQLSAFTPALPPSAAHA
jgi:RNA polymerase sigma-70 factor (ECF subfamily)